MNTRRIQVAAVLVVSASTLVGCASASRGLETRDYWPGDAQWKRAALRALKDRGTWIPMAGFAAVSIDDWDRKVSSWAVENAPIFGSSENARSASDALWMATQLSMAGTALAVPNGPGAWEQKAERLVLQELALVFNDGTTGAIKSVTDRTRPDGSNTSSFPSGHASQTAMMARMACFNLDDLSGLSRGWRLALKTTFSGLAGATAWSRVEGGKHYPSDVLFGAALGNFIAVFIHDAFLSEYPKVQFNARIERGAAAFSVALSF
jgi:membrane-associated phospholipid phosphatase